MKKAYIILAHKYPEQLFRLVSRLNDGSSQFFIHIDKKVSIDAFEALRSVGDKLHFVKREASLWASFSIVQATLHAMYAIKESATEFDQIILLSGQDYPIKSNSAIDEFFQSSPHSIFLDYFPIPNYKKWPGGDRGGWYRVDKYYIGLKKYQLFWSKSMNFLATYLPLLRRKQPAAMKPFTGSQWWCMNGYALRYILSYIESHPEYVRFHQYTFAPDELFFHMILVNSTDERIQHRLSSDNKRLMLWEKPDSAHPNTLTAKDFEAIAGSDALFARKFDASIDEDILDRIDQKILAPQKLATAVNQTL